MKRQTRRDRYEKHRPIKLPKERPVQQPKEQPASYLSIEDFMNHCKQHGYTANDVLNHISISNLLNETLRRCYAHNIPDEEEFCWFTPISKHIIDFGDGSPYDVIDEVIESLEKYVNRSQVFTFINKYGWFVLEMEYLEFVEPDKPCLSFYKGMPCLSNELWDSYLYQLKASTSNYSKYVDCTG